MPLYTLRGVEVDFPYEAYPCQLDYMSRVIEALQEKRNALLESPTGTGKTLCLLCASLAWRQAQAKALASAPEEIRAQPHASELVQGLREAYAELKAERASKGDGLPTIIYSSRTHSQLKQVMKELSSTVYTPRVSVLGSRQQSCLNPQVQQLPSTAANQACRSLVAKRACKWHYNVERFLKANPDSNTTVMDIEDLYKLGTTRTLCPYFLSRDMAATADIVFMPYNYLVDAKTRGGLGISWGDAILIFDEAHNVEGVCADAASFDIPATMLAGAIEEAGTAAELAMSMAEGSRANVADEYGKMSDGAGYLGTSTSLRQLQMVLQKLEREVAGIKIASERGFTAPGAFLFELFAKINLTPATWPEMSNLMELATGLLTNDAVDGGRRHGSRASSYRLHALHEALSMAFLTLDAPRTGAPPAHLSYRVNILLEQQRGMERALPTLGYWCFSPGLAMGALQDLSVRSILLTSGTLSPLGSFAQELSIPFPVRLENPHVIDPAQVWVAIVGKGPRGNALNSSYQTRNSSEYKEDLGNAIVNFARIVPDGLLVFFPSYGVLKQCIDAWKVLGAGGLSLWDRIVQHKAPVVEPRESGLFPAAAADFRAKLEHPAYRGAVFFAVCRGKASEGLDFSDRAGRAVIITGIPYATKTDPKVQIKQEVLNEARRSRLHNKRPRGGTSSGSTAAVAGSGEDDEPLSGDTWYVQQAIRAVNQAMGRVIRHRKDYGAIILCDERFQQSSVRHQLSKWLRDKVEFHPNFGAASGSLTKFFKAQAEAERRGLVGEGGQRCIPGAVSRHDHSSSAAGDFLPGGGSMGAFQIATKQNLGAGLQHQQQQQQQLVRSVPAAADMAGLTELMGGTVSGAAFFQAPSGNPMHHDALKERAQPAGLLRMLENGPKATNSGGSGVAPPPAAAPSGGLDAIMLGLGTTGDSNHSRGLTTAPAAPAAVGPYSQSGGGASTAAGAPAVRPWERAAAVVPMRPSAVRPRGPGTISRGPLGADAPGSNMVGPLRRIEQHQKVQERQLGSQQGEEEQVGERPPAAGALALPRLGNSSSAVRRAPAQPTPAAHRSNSAQLIAPREPLPSLPGSKPAGLGDQKATPRIGADGKVPPPKGHDLMSRLRTELPASSSNRVMNALRQYREDKDPMPLLTAAASELYHPKRKSLLLAFRTAVPSHLNGTFNVLLAKAATAAAAGIGGIGVLDHQTKPPPLPPPAVISKSTIAPGGLNNRLVEKPIAGQGLIPAGKRQVVGNGGGDLQRLHAGPIKALARKLSSSNAPSGGGVRPHAPIARAKTPAPPCGICKKAPSESPHVSSCCSELVACYSCWLTAAALRICPGCKKGLKKSMLVKKYFV